MAVKKKTTPNPTSSANAAAGKAVYQNIVTPPTPKVSAPQQSNLNFRTPNAEPPKTAPSLIPHTTVDKRGIVSTEVGGQTFKGTERGQQAKTPEFQQAMNLNALAQQGNTQALLDFQTQQLRKKAYMEGVAQGKSIEQVTNEIITGKINGINQPSLNAEPPLISQEQITQGTQLPAQDFNVSPGKMAAIGAESILESKPVSTILSGAAQTISAISDFLPSAFRFTESKSTEVKKAEANFADANRIITNDISAVKLGMQDWDKVNKDIQYAIEATQDLRKQTKGLGKLNLRYWLDTGREIEAQADRQLSDLQNQRLLLQQAVIEAQQNKQKQELAQNQQRFGI